jgi:hypothetical protein
MRRARRGRPAGGPACGSEGGELSLLPGRLPLVQRVRQLIEIERSFLDPGLHRTPERLARLHRLILAIFAPADQTVHQAR